MVECSLAFVSQALNVGRITRRISGQLLYRWRVAQQVAPGSLTVGSMDNSLKRCQVFVLDR
jgi:hypothetical protein